MPTTVRQIADELGISVSSVSRFLANDKDLRLSQERREQILRAAERHGGVTKRKRAKPLTHTVVVPIERAFSPQPILEHFMKGGLWGGLEASLRDQRFRLDATFFEGKHETEDFASLTKAATGCDGIVIIGKPFPETAATILSRGFPHVACYSSAEEEGLVSVHADAARGLREAVDHLVGLGHRRIGILAESDGTRSPLMQATLISRGLPVGNLLMCSLANGLGNVRSRHLERPAACEAFARWLAAGPSATAVICHNDLIAFGAMDAMAARGLKPGRDISIIGYDNLEERGAEPCERSGLTTIDNPTDQVGRRAARLLMDQILMGRRDIVHELVPTKLIVRETTGPCPKQQERN